MGWERTFNFIKKSLVRILHLIWLGGGFKTVKCKKIRAACFLYGNHLYGMAFISNATNSCAIVDRQKRPEFI